MTSSVGSDAAMVASEGVAQSAPPAAQATAPEAGRTEEDTAGGSPSIVAVVERTRRRLSPAFLSGAAAPPCGTSRRSSGWPLRTQRRFFSRSTMLLRAWRGRILTSGSRL